MTRVLVYLDKKINKKKHSKIIYVQDAFIVQKGHIKWKKHIDIHFNLNISLIFK